MRARGSDFGWKSPRAELVDQCGKSVGATLSNR
jgi:hypothetical protein